MYFGVHVPPHFHADYNEFNAQISITDFQVLKGSLPPKALALVIEWASIHQLELLDNWKSLSEVAAERLKKLNR